MVLKLRVLLINIALLATCALAADFAIVDVVLGQETTFVYNASVTTIFRLPARTDPEVFHINQTSPAGDTFSITSRFCFVNAYPERWFLEDFNYPTFSCSASPCNFSLPRADWTGCPLLFSFGTSSRVTFIATSTALFSEKVTFASSTTSYTLATSIAASSSSRTKLWLLSIPPGAVPLAADYYFEFVMVGTGGTMTLRDINDNGFIVAFHDQTPTYQYASGISMSKISTITAESSCLTLGVDCSFSIQINIIRYETLPLQVSVARSLQPGQKTVLRVISTEPNAVLRSGYLSMNTNGINYERGPVPFGATGSFSSGNSIRIYPCQFNANGVMYLMITNANSIATNASVYLSSPESLQIATLSWGVRTQLSRLNPGLVYVPNLAPADALVRVTVETTSSNPYLYAHRGFLTFTEYDCAAIRPYYSSRSGIFTNNTKVFHFSPSELASTIVPGTPDGYYFHVSAENITVSLVSAVELSLSEATRLSFTGPYPVLVKVPAATILPAQVSVTYVSGVSVGNSAGRVFGCSTVRNLDSSLQASINCPNNLLMLSQADYDDTESVVDVAVVQPTVPIVPFAFSRPSATQLTIRVNTSTPAVRFALQLPAPARTEITILSTGNVDLEVQDSCCSDTSSRSALAGTPLVLQQGFNSFPSIVFTRGAEDATIDISIKYDQDFCLQPIFAGCESIVTYPVTELAYNATPSSTLRQLDILYPNAPSLCRETVRRLACFTVAYPCTGTPRLCREQCRADLVADCSSLNFPPFFISSACRYTSACPEAPSSTSSGGAPQTMGGGGGNPTSGGSNSPVGANVKPPGTSTTSAASATTAPVFIATLPLLLASSLLLI